MIQYDNGLRTMPKERVWFRCKCGKAFSNEVEIDPPDHYDDGAMRYYFEGGSVFYPIYGNAVAQCWECAEGG